MKTLKPAPVKCPKCGEYMFHKGGKYICLECNNISDVRDIPE